MGANISNTNVTNANTIISGGSSSYEAGTKVSPTNTIAPDISAQINPLFTHGKIDSMLLNGTFIDEIVRHAFDQNDYGYESYDGYRADFEVLCTRLGIFRTEEDRAAGMVSINVNGLKSITQNLSTVNNTLEKIFSDDLSSKNKDKFKDDMDNVITLYDKVWDQSKESGTSAINDNFSNTLTQEEWVPLVSEEYFDAPGGYQIEKRGILDVIGSSQFKKIATNIFQTVTGKNGDGASMLSGPSLSKSDGVRSSKSDALIKGEAMINLSTMVSGLMSMTRTNTFCEMLETKSNAALSAFTSSSPNILNTPIIEKSLNMLNDMSNDVRNSAINHLHMVGSKYNVKVTTKDLNSSKTITNDKQPDTNFLQSLVNCTPTVNGLLGIDVRKNKQEFSDTFIGTDLVEMMAASPTKVRLTSIDNYALYNSKNIDDVFIRSRYPYVVTLCANTALNEYVVNSSTVTSSNATFKVPPVPNSGYTRDGFVTIIEPQAYAKRAIHDTYESEISLSYRISGPGDMNGFLGSVIPVVILGTPSGMYYLPMVAESQDSYSTYTIENITDNKDPVTPILPIIIDKPDVTNPEKPIVVEPIDIIKPPIEPITPDPITPIPDKHVCPTLPPMPTYIINDGFLPFDYVPMKLDGLKDYSYVGCVKIQPVMPKNDFRFITFTDSAKKLAVIGLRYTKKYGNAPASLLLKLSSTPTAFKYGSIFQNEYNQEVISMNIDLQEIVDDAINFSIIVHPTTDNVFIVINSKWYSVRKLFQTKTDLTAFVTFCTKTIYYYNDANYSTFTPSYDYHLTSNVHVCPTLPQPKYYTIDDGVRPYATLIMNHDNASLYDITLSTLVIDKPFAKSDTTIIALYGNYDDINPSGQLTTPIWLKLKRIANDHCTVSFYKPTVPLPIQKSKDGFSAAEKNVPAANIHTVTLIKQPAVDLIARLNMYILNSETKTTFSFNDTVIDASTIYGSSSPEIHWKLTRISQVYISAYEQYMFFDPMTIPQFTQRTDPSKLTVYSNTYKTSFSTKYLSSKKITEYFHLMSSGRPNTQWFNTAYTKPELMTPFSFAIGLVNTTMSEFSNNSVPVLASLYQKKFHVCQLSADIISCPKNYSKHLSGWVFDNKIIDKPIISFMTLSDPFVQRTTSPIDVHVIWSKFVARIAYYIPKVVDIISTSNEFLPVVSGFATEYRDSMLASSPYNLESMADTKQFLSDALFDMPNWLVYRSGSPLCCFQQTVIPKVTWALITMLTSISQYSIYTHSSLSTITSASDNIPAILGTSVDEKTSSLLLRNHRNVSTDMHRYADAKLAKNDISRLGFDVARLYGSLHAGIN